MQRQATVTHLLHKKNDTHVKKKCLGQPQRKYGRYHYYIITLINFLVAHIIQSMQSIKLKFIAYPLIFTNLPR